MIKKGYKHSEDAKKKMSDTRKKLFKEKKIQRVNKGCFKIGCISIMKDKNYEEINEMSINQFEQKINEVK